jgi:SAM-dependent methyltransferase
MDKAEFDKFADEYAAMHADNVRISGETPDFFAAYKIADVRREIDADRLATGEPRIVDLGAGVGNSIPHFRREFPEARLCCLDVSRRSLEIAETRYPGAAEFVPFDGRRMPIEDRSVDIGFAACVFHHIAHEQHASLLEEFARIIRPGGRLFIFEHNPLNPLTVRAVNTCPFDENAKLIHGRAMRRRFVEAGFSAVRLKYRLFFPRQLSFLRPLEPLLASVPLGAQYYVSGRKPLSG